MTKFIDRTKNGNRVSKKTIFKYSIKEDGTTLEALYQPPEFGVVELLASYRNGLSLFCAYDRGVIVDPIFYIGIKGDEFDNNNE